MKKRISLKLFLTVMWRGICQVFQFMGKLFGYKDASSFGTVVWRIFATCVTALISLLTCCVFYAFYDEVLLESWNEYNRYTDYSRDTYISNHLKVQFYARNKKGEVVDERTGKVLLKDLQSINWSEDGDSLVGFMRNDKCGYFNRFTGEVVIPESFTRMWEFSEGLAAVEKDGELVFINRRGEVVIDRDFDVFHDEPEYVFQQGYCLIHHPVTYKVGLIDKRGEWALQPVYDEILFMNGFWKVTLNNRSGLYTEEMVELFPTEYSYIHVSDNMIHAGTSDGIPQCYDLEGNLLSEVSIDEVQYLWYETGELRECESLSEEGLEETNFEAVQAVANRMKYKTGAYFHEERYGLMGKDGKRITLPVYTDITAIGVNRYLCQPHGVVVDDNGVVVSD